MSSPGENEQTRATGRLEWQAELDSSMTDLDSRLSHPRRRATDTQPTLPPGLAGINSEMIDEIAWRVAEYLRAQGSVAPQGEAVANAITHAVAAPPEPKPEAPPPARNIAVSIRIRRPLFRWPFGKQRRRRQRMMSFADYRIT